MDSKSSPLYQVVGEMAKLNCEWIGCVLVFLVRGFSSVGAGDECIPSAAPSGLQVFLTFNPGFCASRVTLGYGSVSLPGFFNEVSLIYIRTKYSQFHVLSFDGKVIQTDRDTLAITGLYSNLSGPLVLFFIKISSFHFRSLKG